MKENKSVSIIIRIKPSLKKELFELASKEYRTVSGIITKIITEYIEKK